MTAARGTSWVRRLSWFFCWLFTLATLLALYLWHDTFSSMLAERPEAMVFQKLRIAPQNRTAAESFVIGRDELGQPVGPVAAEAEHIRFDWTGDKWTIKNIAEFRRLSLTYRKAGHERDYDAARLRLNEQTDIEVAGGDGPLTLRLSPSNDAVRLSVSRHGKAEALASYDIRWSGNPAVTHASNGLPKADCGGESGIISPLTRALIAWNRGARAYFGFDREVVVALLGGSLTCGETFEPIRIELPGVSEETFALYVSDGALYFGPGPSPSGAARRIAQEAVATGESYSLAGVPNLMEDARGLLVKFAAGRTEYSITQDASGALNVTPFSNNAWFWAKPEGRASALPDPNPNVVFRASAFRSGLSVAALAEYALTNGKLAGAASIAAFALGLALFLFFGDTATRGAEWPTALASCLLAALGVAGAVFVYLFARDGAALGQIGYPAALFVVLALWGFAAAGVLATSNGAWLGPAFWFLVTALAALGNLVLAQLAFGGDGERWIGFYTRSLGPLAIVAALVAMSASVPRARWLDLFAVMAGAGRGRWSAFVRRAPFGLMLIMIGVWVTVGKEEGVEGWFQPSEFIKLGMVLIVAMAVVGAYKNTVIEADSELRFKEVRRGVLAALGLIVLFCIVPIASHDYSPALIMGATALVLFAVGGFVGFLSELLLGWLSGEDRLAHEHELYREFNGGWAVRPRRRFAPWRGGLTLRQRRDLGLQMLSRWIVGWMGLLAVIFAVTALFMAGFYLTGDDAIQNADRYRGGASFSGIWNRVMSYLDLDLDRAGAVVIYPDEGRQVRLSREAIAGAPCAAPAPSRGLIGAAAPWAAELKLVDCPAGFQADAAVKTAPLGQPNDPLFLRIPVVQNDFIGGFVIGRFGAAMASLMIVLQLAIVAVCCCVAILTYRTRTGYELDRSRRHLLALLTLGAGVLFALQWSLSWCNVFGLLPIVGQPMTLVASAGSHVVMMAAPLIVLVLVAIRSATDVYGVLETSEPPLALEHFLTQATRFASRKLGFD